MRRSTLRWVLSLLALPPVLLLFWQLGYAHFAQLPMQDNAAIRSDERLKAAALLDAEAGLQRDTLHTQLQTHQASRGPVPVVSAVHTQLLANNNQGKKAVSKAKNSNNAQARAKAKTNSKNGKAATHAQSKAQAPKPTPPRGQPAGASSKKDAKTKTGGGAAAKLTPPALLTRTAPTSKTPARTAASPTPPASTLATTVRATKIANILGDADAMQAATTPRLPTTSTAVRFLTTTVTANPGAGRIANPSTVTVASGVDVAIVSQARPKSAAATTPAMFFPTLHLATLGKINLQSTTPPPPAYDTIDIEDETGRTKYGLDLIARPTTWAPECLTVVLPEDVVPGNSSYGFDFPEGARDGLAVLRMCKGGARERLVWTKDWAVRTTKPICLDAEDVQVGEPVAVRPCHFKPSAYQTWIPEKIGRWRKLSVVRNPASNLCLTAPRFDAKDRRIRLQPCTREPLVTCPLVWITTSVLPADEKETHPEAVTPLAASIVVPPEANSRVTVPGQERLLCWVMTDPRKMALRATAVNRTWARECDELVYFSTEKFPGLNIVLTPLDEPESRDTLWRKAQQAWVYIYEHYLDKADWFIRTDDDTYINMDNMRTYLRSFDPAQPVWLGRLLYAAGDINQSFYSGGATNIASRETMRRLGEAALHKPGFFSPWDTFADDLEISMSLAKIGIRTQLTLDSERRQLFHTLGLDFERQIRREANPDHWYWAFAPNSTEGRACCSRRWIASHYTSPYEMHMLHDMHNLRCEGAGTDPY